MTRDAPIASATSVADSAAVAERRVAVTWRSDSEAHPLGQLAGALPQRAEHAVDLVLDDLVGGGVEPVAVRRVLLELGAEGRPRERLEQVEHHPLRHRVPHHVRVTGRGHRDHVAQVAGRPEPLQQPEPVPVGQVHVEQDQVDVAVAVQVPHRVRGRARHPGHLEALDPADVRRVRLRRGRLVLDDEHARGHGVDPVRRAEGVTVNSAPPYAEVPSRTGRRADGPPGRPGPGRARGRARSRRPRPWSTSRARAPSRRRRAAARDRCPRR